MSLRHPSRPETPADGTRRLFFGDEYTSRPPSAAPSGSAAASSSLWAGLGATAPLQSFSSASSMTTPTLTDPPAFPAGDADDDDDDGGGGDDDDDDDDSLAEQPPVLLDLEVHTQPLLGILPRLARTHSTPKIPLPPSSESKLAADHGDNDEHDASASRGTASMVAVCTSMQRDVEGLASALHAAGVGTAAKCDGLPHRLAVALDGCPDSVQSRGACARVHPRGRPRPRPTATLHPSHHFVAVLVLLVCQRWLSLTLLSLAAAGC